MKKIRVLAALALIGITSAAIADEGYQAPLGLKWGESKENFIKKYNASPADKLQTRMRLYVIGNPPVKVPGFQDYYALLDQKYGLVKILIAENISEDVYGYKGTQDYKKLQDILSKKYGSPSVHDEYSGKTVYTENDEFYQCLAYQGCGTYSTIYNLAGGGMIGLQIHGKGRERGQGYITISYESTLFDQVTREQDSESKNKAEQGL
ncbi:hypothetical protein PANNVG_01634 [Pantoea sp. Nvir]|uniref:hypothetical protein n=1 Tax=Pantoea sp. Nvir TaxID=2576760 RepID=UPI0030CCC2CB